LGLLWVGRGRPVVGCDGSDDLIFNVFGGAVRAAKRSSWVWLQARVAPGQVALDEGNHPPPRDPVLAGKPHSYYVLRPAQP
jgi:hypothetical protein